jgi:hypothetical protein
MVKRGKVGFSERGGLAEAFGLPIGDREGGGHSEICFEGRALSTTDGQAFGKDNQDRYQGGCDGVNSGIFGIV